MVCKVIVKELKKIVYRSHKEIIALITFFVDITNAFRNPSEIKILK